MCLNYNLWSARRLERLPMSGRLARKKQHQSSGSEYGDASKCQTHIKTPGFLAHPANHVRTEEASKVGYGANQGDTRSRCEAGEEFGRQGVERPVDAVYAEGGDTEERHSWEDGVRCIHGHERGGGNERGNRGVKLSFLCAVRAAGDEDHRDQAYEIRKRREEANHSVCVTAQNCFDDLRKPEAESVHGDVEGDADAGNVPDTSIRERLQSRDGVCVLFFSFFAC